MSIQAAASSLLHALQRRDRLRAACMQIALTTTDDDTTQQLLLTGDAADTVPVLQVKVQAGKRSAHAWDGWWLGKVDAVSCSADFVVDASAVPALQMRCSSCMSARSCSADLVVDASAAPALQMWCSSCIPARTDHAVVALYVHAGNVTLGRCRRCWGHRCCCWCCPCCYAQVSLFRADALSTVLEVEKHLSISHADEAAGLIFGVNPRQMLKTPFARCDSGCLLNGVCSSTNTHDVCCSLASRRSQSYLWHRSGGCKDQCTKLL
jgi:hypothetical protein